MGGMITMPLVILEIICGTGRVKYLIVSESVSNLSETFSVNPRKMSNSTNRTF